MGGTPLSGVDFAFDAIGVAKTTEQALQAARGRQIWEREGGTAVIIGVPHGAHGDARREPDRVWEGDARGARWHRVARARLSALRTVVHRG